MSPVSGSRTNVLYANGTGNVYHYYGSSSYGVRPSFYLSSDIQLGGQGTAESPYYIKKPATAAAKSVLTNLGQSSVTTGNGAYEQDEEGRYIFKGTDAGTNNRIYIKEGGANILYRIYSIEADGTIKVIRDEKVINMNFDVNDATRRKSGYCTSNYCNAWAAMTGFTNGTQTGDVSADSSIKEYIDSTFAPTLDDKSKIVTKTWNIGGTAYNRDTLENAIADESKSKWSGDIALLTASEYVRANSETSTCGTLKNHYKNSSTCKSTNYLFKSSDWWLLSPDSSTPEFGLYASNGGFLVSSYAADSDGVRPSFYLCSGLTYGGKGTSGEPYYISGGSCNS